MPPAARVGDPISQLYVPVVGGLPTGTVGPPGGQALPASIGPLLGVPSVRIGGEPAAVTGTVVVCDLHAELLLGNLVLPSLPTGGEVLIGGFPAARKGDKVTCQASISGGALNVLIGGA
ncbi:putative Zn-binding protein involved in type VI secretion [Kitasatospora sp. MAP12-15]|uniref:PAAR domain-containing protein n=1 Tax=unclassified Kitasatospora TaxID=2633591 RepID=UPI0024736683|nr:PAAR domain-containing protein [Kitasatospora sp. MAP12-44]MDH6113645.1 putative Zn-binding protein involved in type VI secretion [Kitasatospora sp. MAP12-44]